MKKFEPEDLNHYQTIDALAVTADGEFIACRIKSVDSQADSYQSKIWLFRTDGSEGRQYTFGSSYDDFPSWSPDCTQLAFQSDRADQQPQIYLISRAGGEARQLSHFEQGVVSMAWCPDGTRLLALCPVKVDPERRGERGSGEGPKKDAPELVWRLPYKTDGIGYTLGREIHLFIIDVRTGECRQITDGPYDVRGACWSPDGKQIAYCRTRNERAAHCTDLWSVAADGSNERQLTHDIAVVQFPKWSPDGRWIVFSGSEDEGDAQVRLWLLDVRAGRAAALGQDSIEVVSGDGVRWSPDSADVTFVLARNGRQVGAKVSVPRGDLSELIAEDTHIGEFVWVRDQMVYTAESAAAPAELFIRRGGEQSSRQLSHANPWWSERAAHRMQLRKFMVPDGEGGEEQIEGWLLLPADAQQPVPLLVDVHGGPASYALLSYMWHPHWSVLCSRGWAVLALNPVGSSSYGREFASRLRGHWGTRDLDQQIAAAKVLQEEGVCDARVAISGKSYGGYMAAWAIGHTDLFRAAIVIAPVTNLETHYSTSDSGYYADPYSMYGEPFIEREKTRRLSPMQHVEHARTPTLILQGKDDERCPRGQAEDLFVTLLRSGETPAEMVLYPGGTHHFFEEGRPSHRIDAVVRLVGWLDKWIDVPLESAGSNDSKRSDRQ
ncbi:S9 family peptidase [Steroidobacter sp. S1-65]|uniref:Acyl-peptide hydrolase n=1 Tax=Steroidobacter gossypii TaxID=2805490 RepID=A0ABS1WY77_9GAMM|nr:S9 family peptidase [Steroidobacter gossypii]MBM0105931.1 S9 family peptidase [Steroidobacter gossypii]